MPIGANGSIVNWTTPTRANLTSIAQAIHINLPWFFPLVLVVMYIGLLVIFSKEQGRKKFIVITVIPMVASWIMVSYALVNPIVADAASGLAILTTLFVFATSG